MANRQLVVAIGLCLLFPAGAAIGQQPPLVRFQFPPRPEPSDPEIRRLELEIAKAKAALAKMTEDLRALEKRLARVREAQRGGGPIFMFPYDIERAMIGDGMKKLFRPQSLSPDAQRLWPQPPPRVEPRK
jgi:hypothetical protein